MSDLPFISVVDDDEAVRRSVSDLLRSIGYQAQTFASGADFLAAEGDRGALCVISDVQMPGMTGLELREALAAAGSIAPFILMTAFDDESVRWQAIELGVHCFLRKPFAASSLIECISEASAGRSCAGSL